MPILQLCVLRALWIVTRIAVLVGRIGHERRIWLMVRMKRPVRVSSGRINLELLVELFWAKYAELKAATAADELEKVEYLDREISGLLQTIFDAKASSLVDIRRQFSFAIALLNEEAEDLSCVRYNSHMINELVNRYLLASEQDGSNEDGSLDSPRDAIVNTSLFDNISERITIISPAYRVSYSNSANAGRHNKQPSELIGLHLAEVVGFQRFQSGFKDHIDRALAGEIVTYTYADDYNGQTVVNRCRLSPYYDGGTVTAGVMMVVSEIADRRRSSAA